MESTDGGESFESQNRGFIPIGRSHIEVYKQNDDYIYAITDEGIIKSYVSTNGGLNFTGPVEVNTSAQGGYNMFVKIVSGNPDNAFIGGVQLFKTTNTGLNYCRMTGPSPECNNTVMHDDYHYMDIDESDPSRMAVVNDGGIFFSTSGGTVWTSINYSLSLSLIYRMNSSSYRTIIGLQDNGYGILYPSIVSGSFDIGEIVESKFNPGVVLFNINNEGKIMRSTNGGTGTSGNAIALPGYWGTAGADWIGAMEEHPSIPGVFYYAKRNAPPTSINFWKSTDFGETWGEDEFGSVEGDCAPQTIAVSSKDPQIVYMTSSGFFGTYPFTFGRGLFKSENGGVSWTELIEEDDTEIIPFHYITRVVTAPAENSENPDEVYITLSGFFDGTNLGHVFKSTNEGASWEPINGNLPNTPVNDIIWWQSGCDGVVKTLAVGTDVGVFSSTNGGSNWKLIAEGLPNVPVMDLEYLPFKNSIRAATFGRGVWEVELEGDIYIKNTVNFTTAQTYNRNIVICNGGELNVDDVLFTMNDNKQIIVKNGGKLIGTDAAFYSSNSWNGILVEPGGEINLNGCYFNKTNTAITIEGDIFTSSPETELINCTFQGFDGSVSIHLDNRDNVNIEGCHWVYSSNPSFHNAAIISVNSSDLFINDNNFNITGTQDVEFAAILVDYGSDIVISYNTINNLAGGITVLNSSPFIYRNEIEYTSSSSHTTSGIIMSNSYSANVKQNTILDYDTGIKLINSSPLLFENTIINDVSASIALECTSVSSPRLCPQETEEETVWDAGKNILEASTNSGIGMTMYNYSIPDLNFGCNEFNTASYSIQGNVASGLAGNYYLLAKRNSWNSFSEDVYDADFDAFPPGCHESGGSTGSDEELVNPPQPIIISYGNGIYDTIQITNRSISLLTDKVLFFQAAKEEIHGNYTSAITKYKQIVQNYQDSVTAINSLSKILHCNDKMQSDSSAYTQLRQYYIGLIQSNSTDTAFVNASEELAAKCLVRMGYPTDAITEYESIISNTNDSLEMLCAELNIIETYMIIQQSGDAPGFTGRLSHLKPSSKEDAYRKIMNRLNKNKPSKPNNKVPLVFSLSQNYPNPFNPVTKIKFAIPSPVKVTLVIYDILGRVVKTLVNEFKDAGNYSVYFDGTGFASGVYFYRIEAGNFTASKKMVLVK